MQLITKQEAKSLGLPHYFTGNKCVHGHISKRRVSNGTCYQCHLDKNAKWRDKNPSYMKDWRQENIDELTKKAKEKYQENKDMFLARCKQYRDANKDKTYKCFKDWSQRNKEKIRIIQRKYESKANVRLSRFMRRYVFQALCGEKKTKRSQEILGYTKVELKIHLEKQFTKSMNWENYGSYWHIDHIIPISYFVKSGERDIKVINALSNLMPLEAKENIIKSDSIRSLL